MAGAIFLAYSPIFLAYGLNGYLLDINKDNPAQGYYYIFLIALISSAVGAICAIILYKLTKLKKSKENNN